MINQKPGETIQSSTAGERSYQFSLISLAAAIIVLLISLFLLTREAVLSLKSYNIAQGVFGSPWVGLDNFKRLFSSFAFPVIMRNTIIFNLLFAGMFFAASAAAGYLIRALPRRIGEILAMLGALLAILPSEVYVSWLFHTMGTMVFANAGAMRFLHPFICMIKYLGIPLTAIYLHNEVYENSDLLIPIKIAGLFSMASLVLITSGFFSITNSLINPLTVETMDISDTYIFRTGFAGADFDLANALAIVRMLITLVSAAILFLPIMLLFRSIFDGEKKTALPGGIPDRLISAAVALGIFAALYFLPFILKGRSFSFELLRYPDNIALSFISCLVLSSIAALISTLSAVLIGGAFVSPSKPIRITTGVIMAIITIVTIGRVRIGNYLLMRDIGAIDTGFAVIMSGCFSVAAVWAMACMMRNESSISSKTMLYLMLGMFLVQTALIFANITPQLPYQRTPKFSPVLMYRQMILALPSIDDTAQRAQVSASTNLFGFLTALPSILLTLAAAVLIPKRGLLAVISAGIKG